MIYALTRLVVLSRTRSWRQAHFRELRKLCKVNAKTWLEA